MIQIGISNKPVVYKQKLITPCLFGCFRFTNKTSNIQIICFFFYLHQPGGKGVSHQLDNSLFHVAFFQMKNFLTIACHGKKYIGKCQCHMDKFISNVFQLHHITLQKISSRRHIEEKVFHANGSANCTATGYLI